MAGALCGALAAMSRLSVRAAGAAALPGFQLPALWSAGGQARTATKKAGGSTKNGRKSAGKRLGIKKHEGAQVVPGNIIVRQRGTNVHPGYNVGMGKDHTLFALTEGRIKFTRQQVSFDGRMRKFVHVRDAVA